MHNFLTLNRDLRTDANYVTSLLDNVASVFALPEADNESYYSFSVNTDFNPKGSIYISYESTKPVKIYISDFIKKPQESNCCKELPDPKKPNLPYQYLPF